jgi:hypothetical protein
MASTHEFYRRTDRAMPVDDEPAVGGGRVERIDVRNGNEDVAKVQLAARWAERFAPSHGDSPQAALRRLSRAYEYIDSVTHGLTPEEP